ncbi:FixH family protein [Pedobacter sp. ASV28]|uniref:FixH family protein n=1 Tax=Pedobacter sp. ASV28 TaxID=2795123 RepID=UPI0018ED9278|nr:FixH family protein [Pedobacter sp. ASV28]
MNWGTKIVLGMAAFMLFIIGMVVYMFKVHGNDDLVEEDYYEKGINYDREYEAKRNTLSEHADPVIKLTTSQLIIQLKVMADYRLKLMRPSSAKKDIQSEGKTIGEEHLIIIDRVGLDKGLWSLKLEWKANGKTYQYGKDMML